MKKSRTVIFLDIDGVLQPPGKQDRFRHDMDKLREDLAVKYNNDEYLTMDKYDLAAVYYDWHPEAVEHLRKLCIDYKAEIIISSDWRFYNPLPRLRDYFRLHDLDGYISGETVQNSKAPLYRCGEVMAYLQENPEVKKFVIIDDRYGQEFNSTYPDNFVYTSRFLDKEAYEKAAKILAGD